MKSETITSPDGKTHTIPTDVALYFPRSEEIDISLQHYLVEIPWDDKYFALVPKDFLQFFKFVLPYLHVRTTDVHTAVCLGMLDEFISTFLSAGVNRNIVGLSLILHDCGWSALSPGEIASSLAGSGVKVTAESMGPKEKHAVEGAKIAKRLLEQFPFSTPLTTQESERIIQCVLYHDKPWEVSGKVLPIDVQVLVDLDHIWSFTHQNFWQNIVRKDLEPEQCLKDFAQEIDDYFVTDFGKNKAKSMLKDREKEVYDLENSPSL